jgi:hypothetical protein
MRHDRQRDGTQRPQAKAGRAGWPRRTLVALSGAALGLVGVASVALPAARAASTPVYTAQATGQGAQIDLFGTELTGASASVAVDATAPLVRASGSATLTPGLVEQESASANADGASKDEPSTCTQGGGTPAGTPVGASLGLACAQASASLSSSGVPSGSATGRVTGVDASVTGLLGQILSSGGNTLVHGLEQLLAQLDATPLGAGSASCPSVTSSSSRSSGNPLGGLLGSLGSFSNPLTLVLGSLGLGGSGSNPLSGLLGNLIQGLCQALVNVQRVASSAMSTLAPTVTVHLGPVTAKVNGTDAGTATASARGSTAEVAILPGVGCDAASLTACASHPSADAAPLIEIQVAPASAADSFDGSRWTPSATAALATIDLNIPGFRQQISLAPGQAQTLLAGTPLETVVDLGSTSVQGPGAQAEGASIDLLKGVNGGILLNLGSASVTGGAGTATSPTTSPGGGGSSPGGTSQVTTGPAGAQVTSATSVHTGAWWAGSLPYLAGAAGLGGLLLGWPRLRSRCRLVRLLARSARR